MGSNQFFIEILQLEDQIYNLELFVQEGPNIGDRYKASFDKGGPHFTIGRKPGNDICYEDQHLSNLHAQIYRINDKLILEDASSTNGTWRRLAIEEKISEYNEIHDQMQFKVGNTSAYRAMIGQKHFRFSVETQTSGDCIICCENDRDSCYLPCRHIVACMKCSKNLENCPMCKEKIMEYIRVYTS